MANKSGEEMPSPRIITIIIALVLALNGGSWWAINQQSKAIGDLTKLINTKMDDRYRRREANAAHTAILNRIVQGERRDEHLESKIDTHQTADDKIHQ
jgi:hypothetical protein